MIWVILAAVGVPLWLIAIALITLLLRNRTLRHRPGNGAGTVTGAREAVGPRSCCVGARRLCLPRISSGMG
jgi:hypothetical protein